MDNLPISYADMAIIAVLLLSALLALARGFVREVLSIAGWIGAAVITYFALPKFQEGAREWFAKEWEIKETIIADIATGSAIFVVALIVFSILTIIISKRIQESEIGPLDRSLGFLFGIARGAFVVCLAYLVLIQFIPPKDHPTWIKEAKSLSAVQSGALALTKVSPKKIRDNLKTTESWTDKVMNQLGGAGKMLNDAAKKVKEGYTDEQRKQLDRLFKSDDKKDEKKDSSE